LIINIIVIQPGIRQPVFLVADGILLSVIQPASALHNISYRTSCSQVVFRPIRQIAFIQRQKRNLRVIVLKASRSHTVSLQFRGGPVGAMRGFPGFSRLGIHRVVRSAAAPAIAPTFEL
jgi:hypothetical protein